MIFVVLAVWLIGTWVTKFTLSEMAVFTPVAILALGAFVGVVMLWVKIVRESLRSRGAPDAELAPTASRAAPAAPSGICAAGIRSRGFRPCDS